MLTSSLTRQPRNLREVLGAVGPRPPIAVHSNKHVYSWFAEAVGQRRELARGVQQIARSQFGFDLPVPPLPIADAVDAAGVNGRAADVMAERLAQYDNAFDEAMNGCPYFARLEYTGPHECIFRYCDAVTSHGVLDSTHHIHAHEHHLVQTQERRLDDPSVVLPSKQRRIVRQIPATVHRQLRVVTGMLVLMKEQDCGVVRREHAVGRTLRQVAGAARRYGPEAIKGVAAGAAAAGVVAGAVSVIGAIASSMAAAAVVAAADPALVIGDLVISGWLEPQE